MILIRFSFERLSIAIAFLLQLKIALYATDEKTINTLTNFENTWLFLAFCEISNFQSQSFHDWQVRRTKTQPLTHGIIMTKYTRSWRKTRLPFVFSFLYIINFMMVRRNPF